MESSINVAMQDLNSIMSGLTLIHTCEMQQQLQRQVEQARVSDARRAQELEQANQQDWQQLREHLSLLLGGQAELEKQLAAASQEQQQAWGTVKTFLLEIRSEVSQLTATVHSYEEQKHAGSSAGGQSAAVLVRGSLMLDSKRVQWGQLLKTGGFARVYKGTFDGASAAIKVLDLAAFAGGLREKVRREVPSTWPGVAVTAVKHQCSALSCCCASPSCVCGLFLSCTCLLSMFACLCVCKTLSSSQTNAILL